MSAETPAKKNYKDTVRLPKTDFPMKADLVAREPQRLAKWEASGLYQRIMKQAAGRPKFILHDGPPSPTATSTWAPPSTRCSRTSS